MANLRHSSGYYPFGMLMPNRHSSTGAYRYGLNGMEVENNVSGNDNHYTTPYRQYNPRLGRWMTTDPIVHVEQSPYTAFNNNPIYYSDPSGLKGDGGGKMKKKAQHRNKGTKGRRKGLPGEAGGNQTGGDARYKKPTGQSFSGLGIVASSVVTYNSYITNGTVVDTDEDIDVTHRIGSVKSFDTQAGERFHARYKMMISGGKDKAVFMGYWNQDNTVQYTTFIGSIGEKSLKLTVTKISVENNNVKVTVTVSGNADFLWNNKSFNLEVPITTDLAVDAPNIEIVGFDTPFDGPLYYDEFDQDLQELLTDIDVDFTEGGAAAMSWMYLRGFDKNGKKLFQISILKSTMSLIPWPIPAEMKLGKNNGFTPSWNTLPNSIDSTRTGYK